MVRTRPRTRPRAWLVCLYVWLVCLLVSAWGHLVHCQCSTNRLLLSLADVMVLENKLVSMKCSVAVVVKYSVNKNPTQVLQSLSTHASWAGTTSAPCHQACSGARVCFITSRTTDKLHTRSPHPHPHARHDTTMSPLRAQQATKACKQTLQVHLHGGRHATARRTGSQYGFGRCQSKSACASSS